MERVKKAAMVLLGAVALSLGSLAPASGAAIVEKAKGDFVCSIDAGDIPGLPAIAVEDATVTIVETPNGGLMFHCSGRLPSNISVPNTRQGYLPCFASATAFVWAHYAITAGDRIQYTCRFPAGSV
jgi:hypothetical protein